MNPSSTKQPQATDLTLHSDDIVAPGKSWDNVIQRGGVLRIIDLHGQQGVDFLCYNAKMTDERYHAPNTIKAAQSIHITNGSVLYSDYANPLMSVISDTTAGRHDTIAGCCSSWSNEMLYGVADVPGCRENFLGALEKYGMGWTDIVPNINFFCKVPVYADGSTADSVFVTGPSTAGDYIELEAQMDVLAVISNCPQINNPCNSGDPTEIQVKVYTPNANG